MQSALTHLQVITYYIQAELAKGRLVGPLSPTATPLGTHLNRFGVPQYRQMVTDYRPVISSRPQRERRHSPYPLLPHTSVDEVAEIVTRLGRGAKIDIEAVYRLVPVRPLQAVQWVKHIIPM